MYWIEEEFVQKVRAKVNPMCREGMSVENLKRLRTLGSDFEVLGFPSHLGVEIEQYHSCKAMGFTNGIRK